MTKLLVCGWMTAVALTLGACGSVPETARDPMGAAPGDPARALADGGTVGAEDAPGSVDGAVQGPADGDAAPGHDTSTDGGKDAASVPPEAAVVDVHPHREGGQIVGPPCQASETYQSADLAFVCFSGKWQVDVTATCTLHHFDCGFATVQGIEFQCQPPMSNNYSCPVTVQGASGCGRFEPNRCLICRVVSGSDSGPDSISTWADCEAAPSFLRPAGFFKSCKALPQDGAYECLTPW